MPRRLALLIIICVATIFVLRLVPIGDRTYPFATEERPNNIAVSLPRYLVPRQIALPETMGSKLFLYKDPHFRATTALVLQVREGQEIVQAKAQGFAINYRFRNSLQKQILAIEVHGEVISYNLPDVCFVCAGDRDDLFYIGQAGNHIGFVKSAWTPAKGGDRSFQIVTIELPLDSKSEVAVISSETPAFEQTMKQFGSDQDSEVVQGLCNARKTFLSKWVSQHWMDEC
ncbi:hypothetical protein SAMN04488117_11877 [Celeribacter baekdonensis]|uniref:Uncharacterized protein n=1 Tax=Celeribacter baekdonensis TaxID=875171 RepID=A0A1G7TUF7_9RHOB|nr:hypothetical protein [Celeribacter baekdonensis]SDG38895.1 hypothetical protein SAMN04488117_11877 [Celeribacter baekdonensis]